MSAASSAVIAMAAQYALTRAERAPLLRPTIPVAEVPSWHHDHAAIGALIPRRTPVDSHAQPCDHARDGAVLIAKRSRREEWGNEGRRLDVAYGGGILRLGCKRTSRAVGTYQAAAHGARGGGRDPRPPHGGRRAAHRRLRRARGHQCRRGDGGAAGPRSGRSAADRRAHAGFRRRADAGHHRAHAVAGAQDHRRVRASAGRAGPRGRRRILHEAVRRAGLDQPGEGPPGHRPMTTPAPPTASTTTAETVLVVEDEILIRLVIAQ